MKFFVNATLLAVLTLLVHAAAETGFKDHFNVEKSDLASSGKSDYFILEPGTRAKSSHGSSRGRQCV